MTNLASFWQQPPDEQQKLIGKVAPTPDYLKPRKPKGCKCKVADAHKCFMRKTGIYGYNNKRGVCDCQCHSETGGF